MLKIAISTAPQAGQRWTLMKQCGVEYAVGGISLRPKPDAEPEKQPWSYTSLAKAKAAYEEGGIPLAVIESRPPMENIKLGLPGRDEEIEVVCEFLRNMGKLEIPVWCYAWMPILGVIRTSRSVTTRGGAHVSAFDHDVLLAEGESSERPIRNIDGVPVEDQSAGGVSVTEEQQWDCLKYFLERVVPVAEEANVKLAMHPDDPPLSPIRGIARIMSSIENYQKLVDLIPSPVNGIGLCQGNFTLMTDDLPSVIRHFGEQKKIHFLHIRDVQGKPEKFEETFHDEGKTDLVECLRAYRDVGYDGVGRPDHYPKMGDESFKDEYGIARLFAVGYLKGLREAVYAERR
ncbi:MAG: mannonate dehydratase [Candidatus Latescibacteria bacterium]|jgi:mannonate dehydratase|nr:mannonate dehydratase [Candidatus Latescibacterota bacterium]